MSSRKYGQKGYQDGESEPRKRSAVKKPRSEGPRGRGLGKPTRSVRRCAQCGADQSRAEPAGVAHDAQCANCGTDLHTCTNCRYFEPSVAMECRAEIQQRVARKRSRNDCELFEFKEAQEFGDESPGDEDVRAAFDALFRL